MVDVVHDCVLFVALFLVRVVPRLLDTVPFVVTPRLVGDVGPDATVLDVPEAFTEWESQFIENSFRPTVVYTEQKANLDEFI